MVQPVPRKTLSVTPNNHAVFYLSVDSFQALVGWRLEQVGLHWCGPFVEWISDLLLTTPGLFQVTTFHYGKSFSLIWGGYF